MRRSPQNVRRLWEHNPILMSKPWRWSPYRLSPNVTPDRNAYRVRKGTVRCSASTRKSRHVRYPRAVVLGYLPARPHGREDAPMCGGDRRCRTTTSPGERRRVGDVDWVANRAGVHYFAMRRYFTSREEVLLHLPQRGAPASRSRRLGAVVERGVRGVARAQSASADPCADSEVVFACGTNEHRIVLECQLFRLGQRRGATQPVAGLRRCSSRLAGWFTAKRTALRVWTTSNRTGPIYGRRVCARGWQRAGLLMSKPSGLGSWAELWGSRMELVDRGLPLPLSASLVRDCRHSTRPTAGRSRALSRVEAARGRFVTRSRQSGRTRPACGRRAHAKRALCSRRPVDRPRR